MPASTFGPIEYTSLSTVPVVFDDPLPTWVQVVGGGTVVVENKDGSVGTFVCLGGEVLPGEFRELTSFTCTRVRMGNGPLPQSATSNVSVGNATASTAGLQTGANFSKQANSNVYQVRGVVDTNVADLAAFVISRDGITYAEGDIVLLNKQTTTTQNGPYAVGTVATTAPLTRPSWWAAGDAIPMGAVFEAGSEGTLYAGTSWKCMCVKGKVIDTDAPLIYPRTVKGTATLVAGTVTLGATHGLWLYSTTKSTIHVTRATANTCTLTTGGYASTPASNTAGIIGTAAVVINACVAAGTINNADISSVYYTITNW
jgi:hypothetical protein